MVEVGPAVKNLKVGQRVVAGFNVYVNTRQHPSPSSPDHFNQSPTTQRLRRMLHVPEEALVRLRHDQFVEHDADDVRRSYLYVFAFCRSALARRLTPPSPAGGMLGYSHFTGGFAGGQAEYVRIPYGEANTIKIPDGVPDEDALFISDVLVTSFHQVEDTGVQEGNIVGIWGVGAIGILAGWWSAMRGASHLIAIDNAQWRLDHFEKVIKRDYPNVRVDTINFDEVKNIPHAIHELTKGGTNGLPETRPAGLDVALECAAGEYAKGWLHKIEMATGLETDTSELLNEMIESTINFGRIGITGVYAAYTNQQVPLFLVSGECT